MTERNWAGNVTYSAARWHAPGSVEEVREVVRGAHFARTLGTRHSFNTLADTGEDMISARNLSRVVNLDVSGRTVTVEGGVRYGELGRFLHGRGFALHNLASLPHISVAGAIATATHGSGNALGSLATAVTALEVVTASGDVAEFTGAALDGAVVSLGALGVVTRVTLRIEPTYDVRQDVYENLSLQAALDHFDDITGAADSVSLFTTWRDARFHQVWLKRRDSGGLPPTLFGARPASRDLHPLPHMSAVNCTPQLGEVGPWHERLPHFRLEFTPSTGEELQSEYFVPRELAPAALRALHELRDEITPLLQVSEIRTVAADAHWLSPCFSRASAGLHFTWQPDEAGVRSLLPRLEARLAEFGARPHWGKLFTTPPSRLRAMYPKFDEALALFEQFDPAGKFRNVFLETTMLGASRMDSRPTRP